MPAPYLIIDFDSTFIRLESLDELAAIALASHPHRARVLKKLNDITKQGMEGRIGFAQSLAERITMFQANRQHVSRLVEILQDNITPSIVRNRDFFRSHAAHIYVISGGFSDYILPIVAPYGVTPQHVLANQFTFRPDGTVSGYDTSNPLSQDDGKVKQLLRMHLTAPVYVIGDGYTDYVIKARGAAERFWAFTENVSRARVVDHADAIVKNFDEVVRLLST